MFGIGNNLADKGKELVQLSKIAAVPLLAPLLAKSQTLRNIKFQTDDWDFFVTIAIFRLGIQSVPMNNLGTRKFNKFHKSAIRTLAATDRQTEAAYFDLHKYIETLPKTQGNAELFVESIGNWVLMNLKNSNQLSEEEIELGGLIGFTSAHQVKDWW